MEYSIKCDPPCNHVITVDAPDRNAAIDILVPQVKDHMATAHPDMSMTDDQIREMLTNKVVEGLPQETGNMEAGSGSMSSTPAMTPTPSMDQGGMTGNEPMSTESASPEAPKPEDSQGGGEQGMGGMSNPQ